MGLLDGPEAVVGLALLFFLPGFGLARATFPEWRFRGPTGTIHLLETLTLSLVTSVGLTIVVGFALRNTSFGFGATWANPNVLEVLAALTALGLGVAWVRGAFSAIPPPAPGLPEERGNVGAFETIRELDGLAALERRLRHRRRVAAADDPERPKIDRELADVESRRASILAAREEELRAG